MFSDDLSIYQGDTAIFDIALSNRDGSAVVADLGRFVMAVKAVGHDAVYPDVNYKDGHLVCVFEHSHTSGFKFSVADYEIRYIAGGDVVTIGRGKVRVIRQILELQDIPAPTEPRVRRQELSVILGDSVMIIGGGDVVVDPNIPDLIDFYIEHGAAP